MGLSEKSALCAISRRKNQFVPVFYTNMCNFIGLLERRKFFAVRRPLQRLKKAAPQKQQKVLFRLIYVASTPAAFIFKAAKRL